MQRASCPVWSKPRARSSSANAAGLSGALRVAPCACCAAVGAPVVWRCTSCGDDARLPVAWFMAAGGGCSSPFGEVAGAARRLLAAEASCGVGGCCAVPDAAAEVEAVVLGSAWLIVVVGGCCPAFGLAPLVGPEPASVEASTLLRLSISPLQGP